MLLALDHAYNTELGVRREAGVHFAHLDTRLGMALVLRIRVVQNRTPSSSICWRARGR
jgi:hypothetical protein